MGRGEKDKPGTDWQAKKAAAGSKAKGKGGTEHDRRAPKTDDEILDMIEKGKDDKK